MHQREESGTEARGKGEDHQMESVQVHNKINSRGPKPLEMGWGGERGGLACRLEEVVPDIEGSLGERAESLERARDF